MRMGQCKFGATCKYNHPEGNATVAASDVAPMDAGPGGAFGWGEAEASNGWAKGGGKGGGWADGGGKGGKGGGKGQYKAAENLNTAGYALNDLQPNCAFFMKTGACKFGATCRFNHPEGVATMLAEEARVANVGGPTGPAEGFNTAGYPMHSDQMDCTFYMKTGTCKFSSTCRFNHPEGIATVDASDAAAMAAMGDGPSGCKGGGKGKGGGSGGMNSAGYTLNPEQQDCPFFMKTGTCKFATTCRFNHPEGVATVLASESEANVAMPGSKGSGKGFGELNSAGYPLNPGQEDCSFFMRSGACRYAGTCRFNHPEGVATAFAGEGVGGDAGKGGFSGKGKGGFSGGGGGGGGGHPQNPGQPDCAFYMKTGSCKFGPTCRFNHPDMNGGGEAGAEVDEFAAALSEFMNDGSTHTGGKGGGGGGGGAGGLEVNDVGLPLRAHAEACPNYMTAGACHHGPGCTFNHPSNVGPGMDLTLLNSSGYPLNDGAPTCMFFSKTGICKYGATCFKSHPEGGEGAGGGPGAGASFGGGGFGGGGGGESPSRPGQPPCTFFMKTGTCKFGATCRFDHPTNGSQSYSDPSLPSRSAGGMGQAAPQNQGGYPSRPGQEACAFFMKTGTCKYSATCCFDHPAGQGGNGGGAAQGDYPRNPGQQNCAFYMKTGACKFGATCRFDHPPSQAGGDDGAGGASNGWPEQPTEPQQASYGGGGEQGWAADAGDASNQEWSQVPGWGDQV